MNKEAFLNLYIVRDREGRFCVRQIAVCSSQASCTTTDGRWMWAQLASARGKDFEAAGREVIRRVYGSWPELMVWARQNGQLRDWL